MARSFTWEKRLEQFNKVHGDYYRYEKPDCPPRSLLKIRIECPKHGWFSQTIKKHVSGQGCAKCGTERRGKKRRLSQEEFVRRSIETHSGFYSYDKAVYKGIEKPVTVTCPTHGDFVTTPATHMSGHLCPDCALEKATYSNSEIIEQFRQIHGDTYDYSQVDYKGLRIPVTITCKVHGPFQQQPANHKKGGKCPYCTGIKVYWPDFVKNCHKTHGGKYTYPEQKLDNVSQKVRIICPIHGEFEQVASEHQYKYGCPECGGTRKLTQDEILESFKEAHGDRFDYSQVEYIDGKTPVKIICKEHGVFHQSPYQHKKGHVGCKLCTSKISREEKVLVSFLEMLVGKGEVEGSNRNLIAPLELDIVLPSYKIAIEYNGLYWHSDMQRSNRFHIRKTELCREVGYRLVHIWQDDWMTSRKRKIIKSFLTSMLLPPDCKVSARNTEFVGLVDKKFVVDFLSRNHIQGRCGYTKAFGLTYRGEVVSVCTLIKRGGGWELNRYCNLLDVRVLGGLGKLTKYAAQAVSSDLYSFCDLSMYTGDSYEKAGYKFAGQLRPDYWYIIDNKREHKFKYRRKYLPKFLGEGFRESDSEVINMRNNGYYRIFDCGKSKFVYNRS